MNILAIVLVVIGAVLFLAGVRHLVKALTKHPRWMSAEALITEVGEGRDPRSGRPTTVAQYTYTDADGTGHTGMAAGGSFPKPGVTMRVRYDPDDPQDSDPVRLAKRPFDWVMIALVPIGFIMGNIGLNMFS